MACMYHAIFQRSRNYLTSLPDGALNVLKYANPPPNSQMKPAEDMTTAPEPYAFAAVAYWLSVNPFKQGDYWDWTAGLARHRSNTP